MFPNYQKTSKHINNDIDISLMISIRSPPSSNQFLMADKLLFLSVQPEVHKLLDSGKLSSFMPTLVEGLVATSGRVGEAAMERVLGTSHIPILPADSRLAKLIMIESHEGGSSLDHRGSHATFIKSRQSALIIGGQKLATQVSKACVECKKTKKQRETQRMGLLPDHTTVIIHHGHISLLTF